MTSTGGGTRYEDLTADGEVHVDYRPPLGEPWFEGEDDPDHNPICHCPRVPKQFCMKCAGCAVHGPYPLPQASLTRTCRVPDLRNQAKRAALPPTPVNPGAVLVLSRYTRTPE
ncbi:hypothetical protein C1J00_03575 [Streptomyces cahuitamycinicus]|uniref:Uncharacterized protein n=1 Tax=Streptomyces cahuitamycinicus TaxID=2070367 RepID=A0A2N8TX07_9ACTN|nr:hypothetical protein C1J00_03575 [Streptomyces cahuitamycinicus]